MTSPTRRSLRARLDELEDDGRDLGDLSGGELYALILDSHYGNRDVPDAVVEQAEQIRREQIEARRRERTERRRR